MHTRAHTHSFTNTHILNTHHAPILQAQPSHPAIHMRHLHHTWQTSIYMIKHTHFNKNTHILNTHIFTNTHTSSTRTMRPSCKLNPSTLPSTRATTTTPPPSSTAGVLKTGLRCGGTTHQALLSTKAVLHATPGLFNLCASPPPSPPPWLQLNSVPPSLDGMMTRCGVAVRGC